MEPRLEEILFRLNQAPLLTSPFSHLIIQEIFPKSLYSDLLKHLPDAFYYQKTKAYPKRRTLPLNEDTFALFEDDLFHFWSGFKKLICSEPFLSALLKKFNALPTRSLDPRIQLIKDADHYCIGPHTDIPQKVISLLFYLPTSTDQVHLGTSLYQPLDAAFRCSTGQHYPFELFQKVAQAPFLPNSLFGFLRTSTSFHGVEPIGAHEKERNLLSYTLWLKDV